MKKDKLVGSRKALRLSIAKVPPLGNNQALSLIIACPSITNLSMKEISSILAMQFPILTLK